MWFKAICSPHPQFASSYFMKCLMCTTYKLSGKRSLLACLRKYHQQPLSRGGNNSVFKAQVVYISTQLQIFTLLAKPLTKVTQSLSQTCSIFVIPDSNLRYNETSHGLYLCACANFFTGSCTSNLKT